ncbi:hypothetical protein B0H17DRAFT_1126203 [Mycena rosella]|uniref:Uncharacterized protein n=1 Tax=Mycena rosella TaxID=1033263 RepID=A0AAD7GU31_MYCRO|nr:hypothetical protein B0H17DRAFT_1126203 [Mycena rosella]
MADNPKRPTSAMGFVKREHRSPSILRTSTPQPPRQFVLGSRVDLSVEVIGHSIPVYSDGSPFDRPFNPNAPRHLVARHGVPIAPEFSAEYRPAGPVQGPRPQTPAQTVNRPAYREAYPGNQFPNPPGPFGQTSQYPTLRWGPVEGSDSIQRRESRRSQPAIPRKYAEAPRDEFRPWQPPRPQPAQAPADYTRSRLRPVTGLQQPSAVPRRELFSPRPARPRQYPEASSDSDAYPLFPVSDWAPDRPVTERDRFIPQAAGPRQYFQAPSEYAGREQPADWKHTARTGDELPTDTGPSRPKSKKRGRESR